MAFLVTGGTGFVGVYVSRMLLRDGHKVVAYDAAPNMNLLQRVVGNEPSHQVTVVRGDIGDLGCLIRTCQEHKVDRIIHTAAILDTDNPYQVMRTNCEGALNVLEAGRITSVKKIVLTSSSAVFGVADRYPEKCVPNDGLYGPRNMYGASKVLNEVCAKQYVEAYGVDAAAVRFTHVYGWGRSRGQTFDDELFVKPALGSPGRVPYGDSTHNWLYVEDAARALVMTAKAETTKTLAFTAASEYRSVSEVAAYVRSVIRGADITLLPGKFPMAYEFDAAPFAQEIGWRPEWNIERALAKVIHHLQSQSQQAFP